ncbi:MAG TPA: hypothetical protein DHV28_13615 [Ignavibacteriales bacterium]|nr:hypothetical protein [Ignavibacteriales bacterium]
MADDFQVKMALDIKPFVNSLGLAEDEAVEFGKNLGKDFDGINVTVKDLLERLDDIKEKFQNAPVGSEAWHRWKDESKVIGDQLRKVKDEFNSTTPSVKTSSIQVGAFRTALTQSTYALGQINPMLGNVASSLTPLISGFNTSAARGKGFTAMLGAAGSQIMGPAGILIGIGLLTTAITTWMKSTDKAGESTKSLKDEVKSLVSEYENLMRIQIKQKLSEWTEKYEEQTKAIKERLSFWQKIGSIIDLNGGLLGLLGLDNLSDKEIENFRKLRIEEEAMNKALNDKGRIPQLEATIKYMQELKRRLPDSAPQASFDAYNKSIKKLQKELDKLNGTSKETKEIFTRDSAIRDEISKINLLLKDKSLSGAEFIRLLDLRKAKVNELVVVTKDLIKAYIKLGHLDQESIGKDTKKSLKGPFSIQPIEKVPKPEVFKETNAELERMLFLSDMLTDSFNNAANAVASAMSSSLIPFRQANSVLQIFINGLAEAAIKAIILKIIMSGLGFLGGLLGFNEGGVFASKAYADGGLVRGVPGIDKNLARLSDGEFVVNAKSTKNWFPVLNAINSSPGYVSGGYHGSGNFNAPIIQTIVLKSDIKGRDIRLSQERITTYRRNYM